MIKAIFRSPAMTAVLFIVAAALLLGGTIGAVQAAPRIQSNDYKAEVQLTNIKTALTENQGNGFVKVYGNDSIAQHLVSKGESIVLGKAYDEQLAVRNVGTIPQYVRVTVKKYWTAGTGEPHRVDLDPDLIKLNYVNEGKWIEDKGAKTKEQRVFYYSDILQPGQDSVPLTDKLTIDSKVTTEATGKNEDGKFDYKDVQFRIQARVDAVQTHNANDAMTSAWGRTN